MGVAPAPSPLPRSEAPVDVMSLAGLGLHPEPLDASRALVEGPSR